MQGRVSHRLALTVAEYLVGHKSIRTLSRHRAFAIAQLLFTISTPFDQPAEIDIDGIRQTTVPGPGGTPIATPVSAKDYASLRDATTTDAPGASSATTTIA